MIYNGIELGNYPMCDTDIWVLAVLGELDKILIKKYQKIVVADVVEKEILPFSRNPDFKVIAEKYKEYKENGDIIVIEHTNIEEMDRKFLEKQLVDCNSRFQTGLKDNPHERHKGEIVSAIYAQYFEIPFLKSNDKTFHEGEMGRIAFPDLVVKNLEDMLKDLIDTREEQIKCKNLIKDNERFMEESKRIYKEQMNEPATDVQLQELLNKWRRR